MVLKAGNNKKTVLRAKPAPELSSQEAYMQTSLAAVVGDVDYLKWLVFIVQTSLDKTHSLGIILISGDRCC